MEFAFNEQQEMFRGAIRAFADKEVAPIARECDEREEYPLHILKKLGELGYLGIKFPSQYGGGDGDTVSAAIMAEEMGYASAGIFLGIYVHVFLALAAVNRFGNDEQKDRYLAPGIRGDVVGAWGFAEPDAGSDPGNMKTRAVRDGDSYVLNGTKMFITNGSIADFVVVTAVRARKTWTYIPRKIPADA